MKLQIKRIPESGLRLDFAVPFDELGSVLPKQDRLRSAIKCPLTTKMQVSKIQQHIQLQADCKITLQANCDRCLEEFAYPLSFTFQLTCLPKNQLPEEDEGVMPYQGDEIDLGEVVRGQLFEQIPMRFHCQENCQGLCPGCGVNLNKEICRCKNRPLHS